MTRNIHYLRISLLPACNFNCVYCRPDGDSPAELKALTPPADFISAISCLHQLGIRKVRFTGGEPTLYPQLVELVKITKSLSPAVFTAMTTNGLRLQKLAPQLAGSGLDGVNVSIDTLNPDKFREITGRNWLREVKVGIDAAIDHIPSVKLNTVIMAEINDDEAPAIIRFADDRGIEVRFIEYMPSQGSATFSSRYVPGEKLREQLPFDFRLAPEQPTGAARYYVADTLRIRVGFIEPVSNPFCNTCDRIRLTAEGNLFGCLFSGYSFNLFDHLTEDIAVLANRIDQLIQARTNLGCSAAAGGNYLPNFVVTGG